MPQVSDSGDRRDLIVCIGLIFALSWAAMGYIVQLGGIQKAGYFILVVMWLPGLVSLVYRAVRGLGFADVGWRAGAVRYWALAFLIPLVVAAVSYALSWSLGIGEIRPPSDEAVARNGASSVLELAIQIYIISFVIGLFGALGEELGWRGFLVPKLYALGVKRPLIVSSVIWGLWHMPLILWGGYASSEMPLVSALLFMVIIILGGVMIGWLRMASGSVWTAMLAHAAHNLFLQTAFEIFNKPGPLSPYLAGESGVIPCAVYACVMLVGLRFVRKAG